MRLHNIESKSLLPRFAKDIEWIQNAFDIIVKLVAERVISIDAPLTIESIQALTDNELEAYYEQFGVVEYYADLTRETRENMLYWLARMYRFLGTPNAITRLCKYVYDDVSINVIVKDNIAWNDAGQLIDDDLLDLFDILIEVEDPSVLIDKTKRIVDNLFRVCRNSQTLRDIIYQYNGDIVLNVCLAQDCINCITYDNHTIGKLPTTRAVIYIDTSAGDESVATVCRDPIIMEMIPSSPNIQIDHILIEPIYPIFMDIS